MKNKHFIFIIQKNNKNKKHMKIKNKKTFSLALDHWELCELSINLKSSGFDGDLQINFCVTLTFLEECKRNPPPQDARII
jgi:hypothetical protein